MYRSRGSRRPRRRWPQSRAGGCLLLVLLVIVVLVILSLMFGGFQKGTKSGSLGGRLGSGPGPLAAVCTACASTPLTSGSG
jgi:hypothetical protein